MLISRLSSHTISHHYFAKFKGVHLHHPLVDCYAIPRRFAYISSTPHRISHTTIKRSHSAGDSSINSPKPDDNGSKNTPKNYLCGSKCGFFSIAKDGYERKVAYWLLGCSGLIVGVMSIGAYVRLTESGLSMLDWNFIGIPLPKTEEQWEKEFCRYKKTPEYEKVHSDITLDEYKIIFLNEWIHRMFGRLSGLLFGGGAAYLAASGALGPGGYLLVLAISGLGLSQAFIGKWMVYSGFFEPTTENKTPRVSPYRLSAHFLNALLMYSICLWNGLGLLNKEKAPLVFPGKRKIRYLSICNAIFALLTITYGTLVAGNDAGLVSNTWPKMMDKYVPDEIYETKTIRGFLENATVLQFNHRCLGYLTTLLSFATFLTSKVSGVPRPVKGMSMGVLHAAILQMVLGIVTLLKGVPLHGAMSHHFGAVALWTVLLSLLRLLK